MTDTGALSRAGLGAIVAQLANHAQQEECRRNRILVDRNELMNAMTRMLSVYPKGGPEHGSAEEHARVILERIRTAIEEGGE